MRSRIPEPGSAKPESSLADGELRLRAGRLLSWLLLVVLLAATSWSAWLALANVEQRRAEAFRVETEVLRLRLEERLAPYRNLTRHLAGFFLATDLVGHEQWRTFLLAQQFDLHLPHLQRVWFAFEPAGDRAGRYAAQLQPFARPMATDAPRHLVALHLHPQQAALQGHDIYPANRSVIERAYIRRDTILATDVQLAPDDLPTLAFVSPLFRQHELAFSPTPALEGVIGVDLSVPGLLHGLLVDAPPGLSLAIYRGSVFDHRQLLFASVGSPAAHHTAPMRFTREIAVEYDGQPLLLQFHATPGWAIDAIDTRLPLFVALAGTIISLLAFAIARALEGTRARAVALAERMTGELRRANVALVEMATTDSLTGLSNRRAFVERLQLELDRSLRYGQPLSLLLFDIDHFKRVNDTWGHPVGDTVLRAIGDLLRREVRASDLPARIGGEEFAVLLPHTGVDAAMRVAEHLRIALERVEHTAAERRFRCTASFGVAATDHGAGSAEAMMQRADRALYAAKAGGRNRVERGDAQPTGMAT